MIKNLKLVILALVIAMIVFFILMIKVYAYDGLNIVYVYTLLVTTFMLSRIFGSFFYKSPSKKLNKDYEPTVSFIIPCKNEEKVIYHTIKMCALVNYPKEKIEIIVINDGSTDNTISEMRRAERNFKNVKIKIVDWKINKGKREGMTYGFKNATGEIVIQLDSDSYPAKNTIRYLVSPFKDRKIASVVAHTDPSNKNKNLITKMQTAYYFMSFRALKASESIFEMVFCCSGCCSAYRKEYVMSVLDEWNSETFMGKKILYGDDRALTNQILKEGYKTVYCAEAQAYTVVPETLKGFLKQQTRWKKGWFINSIKATRFVIKKDIYVTLTYFFPLIFITLITPLIAFKALILNPLFFGISPFFYITGIILVSIMLLFHYKVYDGSKYGKYMILWSILNMTVLSYILVYALYDLFIKRNMGWGTR